jgi:hypothetical protein
VIPVSKGDGRLWAISDLHTAYPENREIVKDIYPESDGDWLLVAGDTGELTPDIEWALALLSERFATVVWTPGNHELWTHRDDPVQLRGEERYRHTGGDVPPHRRGDPGGSLPRLDRCWRPCHHRAALPPVRLHLPLAGPDPGAGTGLGRRERHRLYGRVPPAAGPPSEQAGLVLGPGAGNGAETGGSRSRHTRPC